MEEALARTHEIAESMAQELDKRGFDTFVAPVIGHKDYCVGYAVLQRSNANAVSRYTVKATDGDE